MERFEYTSSVDGFRDWYMLQTGSDQCVVVLHGHGSQGDQILKRPDLQPWQESLHELGCTVLSPNLRGNAWMCPSAVKDLAELLGTLKKQFAWRRIVLASGSMGGTGNLIFAMLHPEMIDAVVALGAATSIRRYRDWCAEREHPTLNSIRCAIDTGYSDRDFERHDVCARAERLRMPVWLYHGDNDTVIPIEEARTLADILSAKPDFHYHEIPGGNHDSPLSYFPELIHKTGV